VYVDGSVEEMCGLEEGSGQVAFQRHSWRTSTHLPTMRKLTLVHTFGHVNLPTPSVSVEQKEQKEEEEEEACPSTPELLLEEEQETDEEYTRVPVPVASKKEKPVVAVAVAEEEEEEGCDLLHALYMSQ
jgi:hypothetical protein